MSNNSSTKDTVDPTTPKPLTSLDNYRLMGKSGLRVSPLCLGAMTFGTDWGFGSGIEDCKAMYDYYVSKGGNFIDTANIYTNGESEKIVGQLVAQNRSQMVVATKYTLSVDAMKHVGSGNKNPNPNSGGNHRKSMVENLHDSLARLNMNCVDILYLHSWEYRTPIEEVLRAMDDVVRSGKAYYVAISDTPSWVISKADTIAQFRGWSPLLALQTRYNLLERSFEGDYAPMCKDLGISTVPWGIAAEGFLTGKYTRESIKTSQGGRSTFVNRSASEKNFTILDEVLKVSSETGKSPIQVATNWVLQKRCVTSPLVGAKNVEQLKENIASLDFKLTPEQMTTLDTVSAPTLAFPHNFINPTNANNFTTAGAIVETRF